MPLSVPSSVTLNGITGTRVYSGTFISISLSVSSFTNCHSHVNFNFFPYSLYCFLAGWAVGAVSVSLWLTSFTKAFSLVFPHLL